MNEVLYDKDTHPLLGTAMARVATFGVQQDLYATSLDFQQDDEEDSVNKVIFSPPYFLKAGMIYGLRTDENGRAGLFEILKKEGTTLLLWGPEAGHEP